MDFPSIFTDVESLYKTSEASSRFQKLEERFIAEFGHRPDYYVRAPGRVNLIGEHIDYSGYAVLPMAIELDTVVAVRVLPTPLTPLQPELTVANLLADQFPRRTVPDAGPGVVIDSTRHDWSNYFLAGYKGVLEHLQHDGAPTGYASLQCMVHGEVPMGSGLSSSSALVCAAALATLAAYPGRTMSKIQLATLCAASERYIGTQGGGMDQAISFLAQPGQAQLIEFDPLRPSDVTLPDGAVFVIANSLVQANKYYSAYNTRVVECRLAAAVLAKRLRLEPGSSDPLRRLGHVMQRSGLTLPALLAAVDEHLRRGTYSVQEVAEALGTDEASVRRDYVGTVPGTQFALHDRARHVYAEALRVLQFRDVCAQHDLQGNERLARLGELMNDSHSSCSQLYECSCPELDQLTAICRAAGALGSRLTGAGWGGCTISLVPQARLEAFVNHVLADYYGATLGLQPAAVYAQHALFVSKPGSGAAIIRLA